MILFKEVFNLKVYHKIKYECSNPDPKLNHFNYFSGLIFKKSKPNDFINCWYLQVNTFWDIE